MESQTQSGRDAHWIRVTLNIPIQMEDGMMDYLMELGAQGVEVRDEQTLQAAPKETRQLLAYFKPAGLDAGFESYPDDQVDAQLDIICQSLAFQIASHLDHLAELLEMHPGLLSRVLAEKVIDPGWADQWREYYHPTRASERIIICPEWECSNVTKEKDEDVVVVMEPGQAFGTGQHATTLLCLQVLDKLLADRGRGATESMFDVGTGSGILAIAAVLLGVPRALAVDYDPLSVEACRHNAQLNGVSDNITAERRDVTESGWVPSERFPLVAANIQSDVLIPVAKELGSTVSPGGHLILSGVLRKDCEKVASAYQSHGLDLAWTDTMDTDAPWVVLVLVRQE